MTSHCRYISSYYLFSFYYHLASNRLHIFVWNVRQRCTYVIQLFISTGSVVCKYMTLFIAYTIERVDFSQYQFYFHENICSVNSETQSTRWYIKLYQSKQLGGIDCTTYWVEYEGYIRSSMSTLEWFQVNTLASKCILLVQSK